MTKFFKIFNSLWALFLAILGISIFFLFYKFIDWYEMILLPLTLISIGVLGVKWRRSAFLFIFVILFTFLSIFLYESNINNLLLKYFLASQSAIQWMNFFIVIATFSYLAMLLFPKNDFVNQTSSLFTWTGVFFGFLGLLVRWYESYLIDIEFGHIPISNLYEVFVLFIVLTSLIYLFYEEKYKTKIFGFFVMIVNLIAIAFIIWYSLEKEAHTIQPLVPALKSYWMKIHVPANFIGYGCFAITAMMSVCYLYSLKFSPSLHSKIDKKTFSLILYRITCLGFIFFTIATILGAFWAAEAWGSYWSWDPKETWALIVWLNYAAWLHFNLNKNIGITYLCWWSIIGLFITAFAFVGVNIFLSGLHSYGEL